MTLLLWIGIALALLIALRAILLYRSNPGRGAEPFDGVVYRVGTAAIAERSSREPRATVVCMHGFVEDLRYFTRFYADPEIQLILINSADYHLPIADPQFRPAEWASSPLLSEGTIEYDAMILIHALQHLPKSQSIRVHGHSRGGAVVLEAAALRPDLFRDVEVVLEAPVLPRGQFRSSPSTPVRWLLPFLLPLWRRQPISKYNRHRWGRLEDARKREMIETLPFTARRGVTMVRNMKSLAQWVTRRDYRVYENVSRGVVLVPGNDQVLDPDSMQDSARHAGSTLQAMRVPDCSHFVLFDRPQAIPPVVKTPGNSPQRRATSAAL
jgi:pimeloyl-ACP methyl ester carboxylesterase